MDLKAVSVNVSSTIGSVSGEYLVGGKTLCMMTLAHGAGAGMQHPWMKTLAAALAERGIATLRFNFPFTENKKGRPDVPAIAHKTIEAVVGQTGREWPKLPLFISGKSFGGRMNSQYLAAHPDAAVKGIIFYGFPLHPPGKPSVERAEHLKDVKQPMLFLSGTRDEFAELNLLENVCSSLTNATLIKIEGANHGFKAGKLDKTALLADFTKEWITKIII